MLNGDLTGGQLVEIIVLCAYVRIMMSIYESVAVRCKM